MSHYSEAEKQSIKRFIIDKVSKTLDDAMVNLEKAYDYDPFRGKVWIDNFHGTFELHFTPANEMNDGKNYNLFFDHKRSDKY
jgi:hypothetical protein